MRRECGVESGVPSKKITNKLLHEITVAVSLLARTGLAHQLDRRLDPTTGATNANTVNSRLADTSR